MRILKYDVYYDNPSPDELDRLRRYAIETNRQKKLNDILGVKDEGESIIENRDRVIDEVLIETERGFISRIVNKIKKYL